MGEQLANCSELVAEYEAAVAHRHPRSHSVTAERAPARMAVPYDPHLPPSSPGVTTGRMVPGLVDIRRGCLLAQKMQQPLELNLIS